MNREDEVLIITTILDRYARHESLKVGDVHRTPVEVYTSPAVLADERDALFSLLPQYVGLGIDLPAPGSFLTRSDLAVPTVLTRDANGTARAFVNVCRHRGAQVVSGRGEGRRLTCPYHSWSYGLDGSLLAMPDPASFPGVDPALCGLAELPLREQSGVLWLLPNRGPSRFSTDSADPVTEHIGPIGTELAGYDLDSYTHWRCERLELAFNWKLVIETFLEPYHFASLHRTTVGPYFLPNLCWVDGPAPHIREVLPRRTMLELADKPVDEWKLAPHAAIVYVLFPNTVFVSLMDHLETWRVYPHPTDPARCVAELDFYRPRVSTRTDEYWEKNWAQTVSTVLTEDFPAMAGVQRGMASGANSHFTVGRNEPAVTRFQQGLTRALTANRA